MHQPEQRDDEARLPRCFESRERGQRVAQRVRDAIDFVHFFSLVTETCVAFGR